MSKIIKVDETVHRALQSQITLNTLDDFIRELVQNGVDAESTCINIQLKIKEEFDMIELFYKDNGVGIDPESLKDFGKRFYTSKLLETSKHGLGSLIHLKTFGFRGEAINSMLNACSSLQITTRVKEFNNGFGLCYINKDLVMDVQKSSTTIPVGTEIIIGGIFDPVPVRKQLLFKNVKNKHVNTIYEIRKVVFNSLVDHPWVKIDIMIEELDKNGRWNKRNIIRYSGYEKNQIETIPFQSQLKLFNIIFGLKISDNYELCKVQLKSSKLVAGIALSTAQSKDYQFVYLNGRPFINDEFMKIINQLFQKNYELWGDDFKICEKNNTNNIKNSKSKVKATSMYGRPYRINPIFVASFETRLDVFELLQDPSKSCYNTKNLPVLISMFTKVIEVYFRTFQNKIVKKEEIKNNSIKKPRITVESSTLKSGTRVSQFKTSELNGRLGDNNKIDSEVNNVYDLDKIRESLLEKQPNTYKEINIQQPKFEKEGSCTQCHDIFSQEDLKKQSTYFNSIKHLELTRSELKDFVIIGQVDKKFILVKYGDQIIGLDQHATDERINLEKMYENLIIESVKGKSKKFNMLENKIPIELLNGQVEILKYFDESLKFWGILFDINFENIIGLPEIILNKFHKIDYSVLKKGILEYCYNLKERKKLPLKEGYFDKTDEFWWMKYVTQMPKLYQEIIKSKSCRSSIMFGDPLSNKEIKGLLQGLEQCYQPFECAHGRPSLYPICGLGQQ